MRPLPFSHRRGAEPGTTAGLNEPESALSPGEEYGLDGERFSAEAWAALVMQFNKGQLLERLLGFDRGHAAIESKPAPETVGSDGEQSRASR